MVDEGVEILDMNDNRLQKSYEMISVCYYDAINISEILVGVIRTVV